MPLIRDKRKTAINLKAHYDDVSISNKKRLAELLESDEDEFDLDVLLAKRSAKKSCIESSSSDDDEEELEFRRINLLKVRRSPPIFFRENQQPQSKHCIPIIMNSLEPLPSCLRNFFCNKATLQTALNENSFISWCSTTCLSLPNHIADALYQVTLLKDKAYCRLVTKSYESLRELMEREVSSALTIPIFLGNSSVLIEQNVL